MAHFYYMGEPARPGITYGPCTQIRLRLKDGSIFVINPEPPKTQFDIGDDIGQDIHDGHALRALRADPRFSEHA